MYPLKSILFLSNNLLLVFLGIFGIGFIIGFHELGHFLFGKLFSLKTPSFAVGFGPKLYRKKIGETEFSLGAIPLGGYVETDKKSFESKPYYQKMLVISGGMVFNMLFAYIVFCLLFILGLPKTRILYPLNSIPVIQSIAKKSEVQRLNVKLEKHVMKLLEKFESLNIKSGDKILAINKQIIGDNPKILFEKIRSAADNNENIILKIEQDIIKTYSPTTQKMNSEKSTVEITVGAKALLDALLTLPLPITLQLTEMKGLPFFEAVKSGIKFTNMYFVQILIKFKEMFVKRDTTSLGGPIAVISYTIQSAGQGFKTFLLFLALISVSLVVLNMIPLPILDGGQALLYTIEAIIGRCLSDRIKEFIFIISWIFILILFVLVSTRDVWMIFSPYMTSIKRIATEIFNSK